MSAFAIHAGKFVLAEGLAEGGYLPVAEGRFGSWSADAPAGMEVLECGDAWVAPGFVDTHIHGFVGHDVMDCDAEGVRTVCRELAKHGTTSWLPTTLTASFEETGRACASVAEAASEPEGARIQGIFLEGPFFTEKHKGAQNPKYLCDPDLAWLDAWQELAGGLIRKSALAPERDGVAAYIAGCKERGVVAALGHSAATYDEALAGVQAGGSVFVHTFNGMPEFTHREPGIVGAALTCANTFCEVIADGMHSHPRAVELLVRARGWQHVALITDCLACGGLPDGDYYLGELPIVLGGGVARLRDAGNLAGSTLTLMKAVRNVVGWGIASPEEALRMASEIPARSAGIDGVCGVIAPGREADFNIISPELDLAATYIGGTLIDKE